MVIAGWLTNPLSAPGVSLSSNSLRIIFAFELILSGNRINVLRCIWDDEPIPEELVPPSLSLRFIQTIIARLNTSTDVSRVSLILVAAAATSNYILMIDFPKYRYSVRHTGHR